MSAKIEYKGTDITSSVEVDKCWVDQYAEEHGDTIKIVFNDINKLWDKWSPQIDDEIRVYCDHADSGIQYVRGFYPRAGKYELTACSIPASAEVKRNGGWQQVTKLQLARDIATRHGLNLKTYGLTDHKFSYLRQDSESDLTFFQMLCNLEGDSFIIYNGDFILYNNEYIESASSSQTIEIKADNKPDYFAEEPVTAVTVRNSSMEYTYGSDMSRQKLVSVPVYIDSKGTAERYATNLYHYYTKKQRGGVFYASPIAEGYAAGSVVEIKTEGAESFNGKVLMYHVRHDMKKNKTKIFFRNIKG